MGLPSQVPTRYSCGGLEANAYALTYPPVCKVSQATAQQIGYGSQRGALSTKPTSPPPPRAKSLSTSYPSKPMPRRSTSTSTSPFSMAGFTPSAEGATTTPSGYLVTYRSTPHRDGTTGPTGRSSSRPTTSPSTTSSPSPSTRMTLTTTSLVLGARDSTRSKGARSSIDTLQTMLHSSELGTMTHPQHTTSVSARYATTIRATYGWRKVKGW